MTSRETKLTAAGGGLMAVGAFVWALFSINHALDDSKEQSKLRTQQIAELESQGDKRTGQIDELKNLTADLKAVIQNARDTSAANNALLNELRLKVDSVQTKLGVITPPLVATTPAP